MKIVVPILLSVGLISANAAALELAPLPNPEHIIPPMPVAALDPLPAFKATTTQPPSADRGMPSVGDAVAVRAAAHPDFFRVALDWPEKTDYKTERQGNDAVITFDRPAPINVESLNRQLPVRFRPVTAKVEDGRTVLTVPVGAEGDVHAISIRNTVALDLVNGGGHPTAPVVKEALSEPLQKNEPANAVVVKSISPPPAPAISAGIATRSLALPISKSKLIELPGDAADVLVGDSTIADISISTPRRVFVIGRKAGETNATILDAAGREIAHLEISVGPDASVVEAAISRILPNLPVKVSSEGGSLILTGAVQSDGEAGKAMAIAKLYAASNDKVVNLLTVAREQQVLIRVRVAEVQRQALKEIGVANTLNGSTASTPGDARVVGVTKALGLNPLNQFAATFALEGVRDVSVTLSLLEQRGLVRNLAEPNLVAVSGETASMLAGGEVPIPVPDRDGIKIEYKPFGVSLSFVPVILDNGTISLKLSTEVSSLSADRIQVPLLTGPATLSSFVVRRASSTVEMPSGGSLMIAGLIQNDVLSGINGIPGAMDLPIIGQLFRSESFKRNETELVVIVTTSLTRAAPANALVAATDSFSPASDSDAWVYGKLLRRFTPGFVQDSAAPRPLSGVGFMLDDNSPG